MAGPGGAELSRVSVKVVPDTDGFASDLKRELDAIERSLRLVVDVSADTTGIRSEVDAATRALSQEEIDLQATADTTRAASEVTTFIARTSGQQADLDLGADTTRAITEATAATRTIGALDAEIKVGIDTKGLGAELAAAAAAASAAADAAAAAAAAAGGGGGALDALLDGFEKLIGLGGSAAKMVLSFTSWLTGLTSGAAAGAVGLEQVGGGLAGIAKVAGTGAAGLAGVAAALAGVLTTGVSVGAQLMGMVVQFQAITFAVGAAGGAIAALPALLFTAGAAFGVVKLGMDGIKKAYDTSLKPAIEDLKKSVSGVFERELTPSFQRLNTTVRQLTPVFDSLAQTTAQFMTRLIGIATTREGVAQLAQILGNVQVTITTMTPGIDAMVRSFLLAGQTTGIFQTLGELIGGISQRIADLTTKLADGGEQSLGAVAFRNLKDIVLQVVDIVTQLIVKATEFFNAAAPGVKMAFDDIGAAIDKIDFAALGVAFGDLVRYFGEIVAAIPEDFWSNLAYEVQQVVNKFGQLVANQDVQAFFRGILDAGLLCIRMFGNFITIVSNVISAVTRMVQFVAVGMKGLQLGVITAIEGIVGAYAGLVSKLPFLPEGMRTSADAALAHVTRLREGTQTELDTMIAGVQAQREPMLQGGTAMGEGLNTGMSQGLTAMQETLVNRFGEALILMQSQDPLMRQRGLTMGNEAVTGLLTGLGPMGETIRPKLTEAMNMLRSHDPLMRARGAALATEAIGGLQTGAEGLPTTAGDAASKVGPDIESKGGPPANAGGTKLGEEATKGVETGMAPLPPTAGEIASKGAPEIEKQVPAFEGAGQNLALGVARGIEAGQSEVINAVIRLVQAAVRQAQMGLQIRSPSKVAEREIGLPFDAGVATGVAAGTQLVVREVISMTESMTGALGDPATFYDAGATMGAQVASGYTDTLAKGLRSMSAPAVTATAHIDAASAAGAVQAPPTSSDTTSGAARLTPADAELFAAALARQGLTATFGPDGDIHLAKRANAGNQRLGRM